MKTVRILAGIAALSMICFLVLCTIKDDNGSLAVTGPTTGPGTSALVPFIILIPDSQYVGLGETLSIAITVLTDSTHMIPLTDARVLCASSSGWISAESLFTDSRGRAVLKMMDSAKAVVTLTVVCGLTEAQLSIQVTNTPTTIQRRMTITPTEPVLKADGKDNTTIDVMLKDANNNPITGQCVQFISSAGLIVGSSTGCSGSGQSATNSQGVAEAVLTSANVNDTAYVTAYLVSDRTQTAQTKVIFKGVAILLQADSTNLKPGSQTTITAYLVNGSNVPIPYSPIFFQLGKGTGSNLTFVSRDTVTGPQGNAQCVVKGNTTGTDSVSVLSAGASSSIRINVTDLSLVVSLDDKVLQANTSVFTTLHVLFTGGNGAPLANKSVQVQRSFKQAGGADTTDYILTKTDSSGKCAVTIFALPYECTMTLQVTAFNTTTDLASATTSLTFMSTRTMVINAIPTVIQADGTSQSTVTVQVKNATNNPMVGDSILFTTNAGMVTALAVTDNNGRAIALLTSDRRNTTATVTATLAKDQTKFVTVQVVFSGVQLTASANPTSINANGKDSSTISITLVDAAKNPIVGEPINFSKQQDSTFIYKPDSVTDNRGEAYCKVYGRGSGTDSIQIVSAGASQKVAITYSSNYLAVDTTALQPCIANGKDSTALFVAYLLGDKTTPVQNATIAVSVSMGSFNNDTIFAKQFTLVPANNGRITFWVKNPGFAGTATVSAYAKTSAEVTTASFQLYFTASLTRKIVLIGTPAVISTNGGKAQLTAVAYDSLNNRVQNERISFNMISGPGGGENLNPPTVITASDGSAISYLIAGTAQSVFHGVGIVASNASGVKSDTVLFTIAGPPYTVSLGINLLKGVDYQDGTFGLPCAAIVTDINGNPVADGTVVTFSLQASGFVYKKLVPNWVEQVSQGAFACNPYIDTISCILPFLDFTNSCSGNLATPRGEDLADNCNYDPGPAYEDINHDGIREFNRHGTPVEEVHICSNGSVKFADINGDGVWDPIEPLTDPVYQSNYTVLKNDSAYVKLYYKQPISSSDSALLRVLDAMDSAYANGAHFIKALGSYDFWWQYQPYPQPDPAVSIARTVQTQNGKAANVIIYGQSNANKVQVTVWAECQGVSPQYPVVQLLPIISDTGIVK